VKEVISRRDRGYGRVMEPFCDFTNFGGHSFGTVALLGTSDWQPPRVLTDVTTARITILYKQDIDS
jgi:hypothetical protein